MSGTLNGRPYVRFCLIWWTMWGHWNLWTCRRHLIKKTEYGDSFGVESNRDIYEGGDQLWGYWSILFCNVKPRSDLFFKHDFVEISILKFRENSLMNCIYMAPHSSTLAWKIPWMEEPERLQSMGSLTVGHNWATSLSLFSFMHWRRKWQPNPVFLPEKIPETGEPGGLLSMGSQSRTLLKRLSDSSSITYFNCLNIPPSWFQSTQLHLCKFCFK